MRPTKTVVLNLRDNEHCKRLRDPFTQNLFHLETLLPFSEAVKLERGNANVRPPAERRPLKNMLETVKDDPRSFHLKNRGITYLCERFEFDNAKRLLTVTIPKGNLDDLEENGIKFGIGDGGHTFEVIERTVQKLQEHQSAGDSWAEPFVRVHFLSGEGEEFNEVDQIVEALNTSLQVQQYTLDEYQNKFEELKEALSGAGLDVGLIAFRENEEKDWHIIEILQRLACFLKDRWRLTQPASMYRSKMKALELYTNDDSRPEFRRLYGVIADVVTFPEFIQSELSTGQLIQRRSLGQLKSVKALKKAETRPGTQFSTEHKMDLAQLLPMAAAFRELLVLKGDRYQWKVDPKEVFRRCASELYQVMVSRSGKARIPSHLGSDMEYWGACVPIVMRTKDAMLEEKVGT